NNGGGPAGSPLGDRHAIGDTLGGTETGGMGGSNIGDGSPLEEEDIEREEAQDQEGPYAGHAGGAVGGTPAESRTSGRHARGGFSPGTGGSRGDSTIGADPYPARKRKRRSEPHAARLWAPGWRSQAGRWRLRVAPA